MSNTNSLLLDTHIWINYLNASPLLRPELVKRIETARSEGFVYVSIISIWEVAQLVRLKRLMLNTNVSDWVENALTLPGVQLLPLTTQIAIESVNLAGSMHKDPADRILVASTRVERLTLVTRDRDILSYAKATKLACLPA